ncbi:uncharacterized protein LOC105437668 [Strongylocentrotus purpuratus]|uniref:Uncharacterized protein n=1 Tax=Strongylocentrotus purpuratus TaxID=7668 RepID=A0A7M7NLV4_STRPU|nr:uncharacterized protein LOC105437668 [Strongylocentrotus purpuratus]|eukprot:XP_011662838.1 PREDICTED: uncharacterized protein LOC105437668 [Strongylocentrotus purpuratus]
MGPPKRPVSSWASNLPPRKKRQAEDARPEGGSSNRPGNLLERRKRYRHEQTCPYPACAIRTVHVKFHVYGHLPNLAFVPLGINPPSAELLRLRGEFLRWVATQFVGDGRDPVGRLVAYVNQDFRPSRPFIASEVERALRAQIEFEGWPMPSSFSISPLNSPACLLHWRVLVHLHLKLSPSLRATFFSWGSPSTFPVSSAPVVIPPLLSVGSVPSFAQVAADSQSAPSSSLLPVSSVSDATSPPVSAFPPLISAGSVPSSAQVAAASQSAPPSDQSGLLSGSVTSPSLFMRPTIPVSRMPAPQAPIFRPILMPFLRPPVRPSRLPSTVTSAPLFPSPGSVGQAPQLSSAAPGLLPFIRPSTVTSAPLFPSPGSVGQAPQLSPSAPGLPPSIHPPTVASAPPAPVPIDLIQFDSPSLAQPSPLDPASSIGPQIPVPPFSCEQPQAPTGPQAPVPASLPFAPVISPLPATSTVPSSLPFAPATSTVLPPYSRSRSPLVYPVGDLPDTVQRLVREDMVPAPFSSVLVNGFDSHFHLDRMMDTIARKGDQICFPRPGMKLVGGVVNFCDPQFFDRALRLIPLLPLFHIAVGVHPKCVSMLTDDGWAKLECLFSCPRVTAVSELGIDYFRVPQPEWPKQWALVRRILGLGCRNMVLVLHLRPAQGDPCGHHLHGEFRDLLGQFCGRHQHIHIHNFTGDAQELDAWMAAFQNVYVGVSGLAVSFNPAQVDMVRSVPSHRLLLETDSPYLAVFPGASVNTPYLLEDVGRLVSRIRGQPFRAVMRHSTENAQRLYSGFACLVLP